MRVESDLRGETWNIRGNDSDERLIEVVVVVREDILLIKIVTVWKI
jgi:hypothetical protein